nr:P-loop containing nucleoside triphosphate hydrolase [Tanacetum cinerariifolium]
IAVAFGEQQESCDDKTSAILAIEKLIQSENIVIDELSNKVSHLLVSLKNDANV